MKKLILLFISTLIYSNSFGQIVENAYFDILLTVPNKTHGFQYLDNGYFVIYPTDGTQQAYLLDTFGVSSNLPCDRLFKPRLRDSSGIFNCTQDSIVRLYSIPEKEFISPENVQAHLINENFYALQKGEKAYLYNRKHQLLHEREIDKELSSTYWNIDISTADRVATLIDNNRITINILGEIVPNYPFKMNKNNFSDGAYYFVEDEKHGLKSKVGEIIIPAKYERITEWLDHQYIVSLKTDVKETIGKTTYPTTTRMGVFNTLTQKMVVPIEYARISGYKFGLKCERPKCIHTFLDTDFKNVYNKEFTRLNITQEGFFYLEDDEGKYYNILSDFEDWALKNDIEYYSSFTYKLSKARFENGNLVLIDKSGNIVFDPKSKEKVSYESKGGGLIEVKIGRKKGIIDDVGNWKIEPGLDYSFSSYGLGTMMVKNYSTRKRTLYNADFKKIATGISSGSWTKPKNALLLSKEVLVGGLKKKRVGVMDRDGTILIPFIFSGKITEYRSLPHYYLVKDEVYTYLVKADKSSSSESDLQKDALPPVETKSAEIIEKEIREILRNTSKTKDWKPFSDYIAHNSVTKCNPKGRPLIFWIDRAPPEVVLDAIAKGVDPNVIQSKYVRSNKTPLFYFRDVEVQKKMIEMGLDINHQDKQGRTAAYGFIPMHMDILDLHIQKGLKLELVDNGGRSILSRACTNYNNKSCEYLLKKGADANSQDEYGMTPLFYAVRYREIPNVEVLLKSGASKKIKTTADYTFDSEKDVILPAGSTIVDFLDLMGKTYFPNAETDPSAAGYLKMRDLINN